MLEGEKLGPAARHGRQPLPVQGKDMPLFSLHVGAQVPLEPLQLFERPRELEADHEIAMHRQFLVQVSMDIQELHQGGHVR